MNKRFIILALTFSSLWLGACSTESAVSQAQLPPVTSTANDWINSYGTQAYESLTQFVSAYPKREAGSDNESAAAAYLYQRLTEFGYQPEIESFDYKTDWAGKLSSQNLVAQLNPDKVERILIGAHYDSMPSGDGADDNASGVAVLLTLANVTTKMQLDYGIDFVFFGSEEAGLKGSEAYYEKHPTLPELMINLDSLIAGDVLNVYGEASDSLVLQSILDLAQRKHLPIETQNEKASGLPYGTTLDASDHAVFKNAGIPILYFEATNWSLGKNDGYTQTNHPDVKNGEFWHSSQDTLPFIESKFPNRPMVHLSMVSDLILSWLQSHAWRQK